ncbi:hypothetical protein PACTADRAFT_905 [Pachysolen tannophilus NRRL Y-2460]|uniref:Uncharacterized protein n=1 Tax=Pachysolen tannophilus NRRL Y-2460 TaxID=669874 RepID=A0A1E4U3E6_PACTA|nr:hypothetical protein PACTADRAFT_905 [Pachysolen tannophilus NRRL Y-2460]
MSGRYVIGGAAALGAGFYLYERRVERVKLAEQQQQLEKNSWAPFQNQKDQERVPETATRFGRRIDEVAARSKDKLDENLTSLKHNADAKFSKLEDARSDASSWANERANRFADVTAQHQDEHAQRSEALHKSATEDEPRGFEKIKARVLQRKDDALENTKDTIGSAKNSVADSADESKNAILKAGDAYIDSVNGVAIAVHDGLSSIKEFVSGNVKAAKDEAGNINNNTTSSNNNNKNIFAEKNFLSSREEREAAARGASSFGENAKYISEDYASATSAAGPVDKITDSPSSSSSIFSGWGRNASSSANETKDQARKSAENTYYAASDALARAKEEFEKTKNHWYSWNKDKSQEANEKASKDFDKAKKDYDDASASLGKWGQDAIDSAKRQYENLKKSASDSLESAKSWGSEKADQANKSTNNALDSANDAMNNTYDQAANLVDGTRNKANDYQQAATTTPSNTDNKKSSNGWFHLKTVDEKDDESLGKMISKVSKGIGENATFFADEIEEQSAADHANSAKAASHGVVEETSGAAQSLKEKLFGKSEETKDFAQKTYDDALDQLNKAKQDWESKKGHWYSLGEEKTDQSQKAAKEKLDSAQKYFDDANSKLKSFVDDKATQSKQKFEEKRKDY